MVINTANNNNSSNVHLSKTLGSRNKKINSNNRILSSSRIFRTHTTDNSTAISKADNPNSNSNNNNSRPHRIILRTHKSRHNNRTISNKEFPMSSSRNHIRSIYTGRRTNSNSPYSHKTNRTNFRVRLSRCSKICKEETCLNNSSRTCNNRTTYSSPKIKTNNPKTSNKWFKRMIPMISLTIKRKMKVPNPKTTRKKSKK